MVKVVIPLLFHFHFHMTRNTTSRIDKKGQIAKSCKAFPLSNVAPRRVLESLVTATGAQFLRHRAAETKNADLIRTAVAAFQMEVKSENFEAW